MSPLDRRSSAEAALPLDPPRVTLDRSTIPRWDARATPLPPLLLLPLPLLLLAAPLAPPTLLLLLLLLMLLFNSSSNFCTCSRSPFMFAASSFATTPSLRCISSSTF